MTNEVHLTNFGGSRTLENRCWFIYEAAPLAAVAAEAPIIPELWSDREEPFKAEFRVVIAKQCSEDRKHSPEELHNDWMEAYVKMGWVYGPVRNLKKKTHPDLVPYAELQQQEQDKDAVFIALCEIARQWIY